ncbi:tetratricopeptide repeat protein [Sphingobium baderi]|uniref:Tetratricopeptide repeat protein n=1 Tax=Sphingobium baderi LL03 TaxID=1114964 RepID=T0GLN5_9SPHN|nr:hypothetical protein [Sphingobium baderi]EQB04731.1 hypothetical protein L485_03800 [Sphingobium baderi LL03]KMS51625.1 hypothetical protein V475_22320 [Sphingobium baderi LL03]
MGLAAIAGLLGYFSVMQSVALVLPDSRIQDAYALAPRNGHVAARYSQYMSGPEASPQDWADAVTAAQEALRQDPTAVEAVATLGLEAMLKGDEPRADRLLAYSQRMSRRDLRTQLMAIELAVAREDIAGALHHYDIALRTKKDAPGALFPVLTSALGDDAIRTALVRTLNHRPIWGVDFIRYVARSDADPAAPAAFFRGLAAHRFPIPGTASAAVVNRLLAVGRFEDAWSYYSVSRQGVDRRRSRDPNFKSLLEAPSAFDWVPKSGTGLSTALVPDPANGLFDFTVSMGNGGVLLQQLQMLPRGQYVVEGRSSGLEQPSASRPYWTVRCRNGQEIGRVEVPNSSHAQGRFEGKVNVPVNCPVQTLALVARSSDDIGGVTGQITHILLHTADADPS